VLFLFSLAKEKTAAVAESPKEPLSLTITATGNAPLAVLPIPRLQILI